MSATLVPAGNAPVADELVGDASRQSAEGHEPCASRSRATRVAIAAAFVVQAVLLAVAARHNLHRLNSDGIVYIRLAEYAASGRSELMVSGFWAPLLSWLMVPFLTLGMAPVAAARAALAISAMVFLGGCVAVLLAAGLRKPAVVAGTWVAAVASVYWSVVFVTPDLLESGLVALATALMLRDGWLERRGRAAAVGVLWALAYLAKAVAFPLMFGLTAAFGGIFVVARAAPVRTVVRAVARSWLAFALIAGPWMAALSIRYHRPTFSTTGPIAHAIVGPYHERGIHPNQHQLLAPEPGRLMGWEDPTYWPYRYWSPIDSWAHARHQLAVIRWSAGNVGAALSAFALFGTAFVGLLGCLTLSRRWRRQLIEERWRWLVVPVAALVGIYLPVYSADARYYYTAYPFVFGAAAGFVGWLTMKLDRAPARLSAVGLAMVTLLFAVPAARPLAAALDGLPNPSAQLAQRLAGRLKAARIGGPVVGGGPRHERVGPYLAFLLGVAWYGDEMHPSAERFARSGARILLVPRAREVVAEFDREGSLRDLDPVLFATPSEAASVPLKVYERRSAGPAAR